MESSCKSAGALVPCVAPVNTDSAVYALVSTEGNSAMQVALSFVLSVAFKEFKKLTVRKHSVEIDKKQTLPTCTVKLDGFTLFSTLGYSSKWTRNYLTVHDLHSVRLRRTCCVNPAV